MTDDSWRTATFRQSVASKIDEAIRQSQISTSRNSMEMESHVFQKAKTKEEYLGFVARLILHFREMKVVQEGPGIPNQISSLQTLASQGCRNNQLTGISTQQQVEMGAPQHIQLATNLFQNLNLDPNQEMNNMQPEQITVQLEGPQIGGQILNEIFVNAMAQTPRQLPYQLQNPLNSQMQGQVNPMLNDQVSNQLQGQQQNQLSPNNM